MNVRDFSFFKQQQSNGVKARKKIADDGRSKRRPTASAAKISRLIIHDDDKFLRIVEQASRIASHRELFELLQSEDIQRFIPHQVLISAWDNFDGPNLQYDVISALPGLRTGLLNHCSIDGLLQDLYKRWLVKGRNPLLLDSTMDARLAHSDCKCALHKFLQGVWSLLVHGVTNVRDGNVSLYLALHARPIVNGHSIERFRLLVDPLITQIDVAFRRIAALKSAGLSEDREPPLGLRRLSRREEEVLVLVSEGKTNVEISNILSISVFTVKNHLKRIMKKLEASNRTEAVTIRRQMDPMPQKKKQHAVADTTHDLMTLSYA